MKYDIAIIGLGPAGHKMVLLALKEGLKVVCFEKNKAGGTCLNLGCIPTKSMLFDCKHNPNWEEMKEKKNKIISKFNKAIEKDLLNKGAEIIWGEATIIDGKIICNNAIYSAENIICAGGSTPMNENCDGIFTLNSDQIFDMETLPKSIAIIGSGAIGIEWARILNALGVEVTVIEKAPNLLPTSDIDVSKRIERIFKVKKIKFFTNTTAKIEDGKLILENGTTLEPEKVLIAIGRKRNRIEGGYQVGDSNEGLMLAHCASAQAKILFEHLYKNKELKEPENIPSVIYGTPEIASIGLREQDVEGATIYNLPIACLAKAHCEENIEGFIKIITKDNQILGAHIISNEASAMIVQIAIAMKAKMDIETLKEVIFPHPTLSEGIIEALENGQIT